MSIPVTSLSWYADYAGIIDTHIHFLLGRNDCRFMVKSLEWLNVYIPWQRKVCWQSLRSEDQAIFWRVAEKTAQQRALVFCSRLSLICWCFFFEEASRCNLRMIAGKVMMWIEMPRFLFRYTQSYQESKTDSEVVKGSGYFMQ